MTSLAVREIETSDIPLITEYWLSASEEFLRGMGADIHKLPSREKWHEMLTEQIKQPYAEKQGYATIWLIAGQPVGHCNVNKIIFGTEAYMHLHLWNADIRRSGMGAELVKMSL